MRSQALCLRVCVCVCVYTCSEAQCDAHVKIFLSCIESASRDPGQAGFAAVKLTALGNPLLLERVSTAIREVR